MADISNRKQSTYRCVSAEGVADERKRFDPVSALSDLKTAGLGGAAASPSTPAVAASDANVRGNSATGLDLNRACAGIADFVHTRRTQDAFVLANVDTRLTEEVRRLIAALAQFGGRAQSISKEIPDAAHFSKLVTSFLGLLGLQLAHALGKGLDKPLFFDDGAEYLHELNLCLSDFVREVDLDGRRFLAVAFVDEQARELGSSGDGADKC